MFVNILIALYNETNFKFLSEREAKFSLKKENYIFLLIMFFEGRHTIHTILHYIFVINGENKI